MTVTKRERDDLLENLLAHRADPAVPLYCPLSATGGFTKVVEAVRVAEAPVEIPAGFRGRARDSSGIRSWSMWRNWIDRASEELALFSELGAPWTIIQSKRENP